MRRKDAGPGSRHSPTKAANPTAASLSSCMEGAAANSCKAGTLNASGKAMVKGSAIATMKNVAKRCLTEQGVCGNAVRNSGGYGYESFPGLPGAPMGVTVTVTSPLWEPIVCDMV